MSDILKFYDTERAPLFNYILGRIGNREQAEDILSEVFVRAIRFEKDGGSVTHLRGLLYRIAKNLITDQYRERGKNSILISIHDHEEGERAIEIPDKLPSIIELLDRNIESNEIKSFLSRLRDESREIIEFRYFQQLEMYEIAEVLDKSEGAVRVQLHRALNELRDLWEK